MPRTGLSPEEIRDKALSVALELIRAQGVEQVRLAAVAKAIGVSHAALYAYFKDKEALLDAATALWLDHLDHVVAKALAAPAAQALTPEARLRLWTQLRYREKRQRALEDPEPYRAYSLAGDRPRPFLIRHVAALRAEVAGLLTAADLGAEEEARIFLEAIQAYSHPVLIIQGAQTDRQSELQELLDVVIAGLKARAAAGPGAR